MDRSQIDLPTIDPRENGSMAAYRYSSREHLIIIDHTDRAELVS